MTDPAAPNAWAALILELINRPGWSQQRLAAAADVNRNTIRRWKRGESENISSQSIQLVADAAGIPRSVAARAAVGAHESHLDDLAIETVRESEVPEDEKTAIIAMIRRKRARFEADLWQDVELALRRWRDQVS